MKLSLTSLFGIIGAVSLAVSQVADIPAWFHTLCVCVSAASVAGLGYHATDKNPRPPGPPIVMFAVLLIVVIMALCLQGCGTFQGSVTVPGEGTVGAAWSTNGGYLDVTSTNGTELHLQDTH